MVNIWNSIGVNWWIGEFERRYPGFEANGQGMNEALHLDRERGEAQGTGQVERGDGRECLLGGRVDFGLSRIDEVEHDLIDQRTVGLHQVIGESEGIGAIGVENADRGMEARSADSAGDDGAQHRVA